MEMFKYLIEFCQFVVEWQEHTGFYTLFLAATEMLNFKLHMQKQKKHN